MMGIFGGGEVEMKNSSAVIAAVFIALGVGIMIQPYLGQPPRMSPGDPGPWLLPQSYAVGMIILAVVLYGQGYFRSKSRATSLQSSPSIEDASQNSGLLQESRSPKWPVKLTLFALVVAYVYAFGHLGFYFSTVLYLASSMAVQSLGAHKSIAIGVVVSIISTIFIGLVMTHFLNISLPVSDYL